MWDVSDNILGIIIVLFLEFIAFSELRDCEIESFFVYAVNFETITLIYFECDDF